MLALHIGAGIWLGGVALTVTVVIASEIDNRIKRARRFGAPWWRNLLSYDGRAI